MTEAEEQGGLVLPAKSDKHVFKAPAPRASILGNISSLLSTPKHGCLRPVTGLKLTHCDAVTGLDKLALQKREANGIASGSTGETSKAVSMVEGRKGSLHTAAYWLLVVEEMHCMRFHQANQNAQSESSS